VQLPKLDFREYKQAIDIVCHGRITTNQFLTKRGKPHLQAGVRLNQVAVKVIAMP
jgi:hypothetical protein